MAKKKTPTDPRRAKIEALRAEQQATERKRSMIFVGIAVVVGLGLIAAAAVPIIMRNQSQGREYAEFGVSASDASCEDVIVDESSGESNHVGPGTAFPEMVRIEYETSPPSSGQHYPYTAGFERHFYDRGDTPQLEELVHNLEHGATMLWYDEDVTDEELADLGVLADKLTDDEHPKFLVAAWDSDERGAFPDDKNVALAHWGASGESYRQYCGQVSGEAILAFADTYPFSDSPEPNGG